MKKNPNLTAREQKLLTVIAKSDPVHGCRASNAQLERRLGIGERQVRATIAVLKARRLIVRRQTGNERSLRLRLQ